MGKSNYGATRWIGFGAFTVQPSEIAKLGFVLFAAAYFAKDPARMRTLRGCLPVLGAGLCICLLILLEPNMSVTMCVGAVMIGMLFLAGASKKALACICIPVLLAVPALILMEPYRLQRLSAFMDPWASPREEGYQLIQSLYGLSNGNLFGVGLFRSRQKYRFLPFAESDFILSVIAEETGFFGVLALFALIAFIVWRGFRIAARCGNFYGFLHRAAMRNPRQTMNAMSASRRGAGIITDFCSRAASRSPLPCSVRSTRSSSAAVFPRRACRCLSSPRGIPPSS